MVSLSGLITAILVILIIGFVFWLLQWGIARINPPEPWRKIADVVLVIGAILIVLGLLLSLVSGTPLFRP